MAGRAVPRGAVPQARRLARERRDPHRGRPPVRQRVRRVGDLGPDLPTATGVPDPDRGAGADVRATVRGGTGPARVREVPGRSGPVERAAGAAGPSGTVDRYHHLFRDMLLAQLGRQTPGLIPVLRRRAAGWYLRNGMDEDALEYYMAAGDVDEAARLMEKLWLPTYRRGRAATVQRWFRWLDEQDRIARNPMLAAQASLLASDTGRPAEAERWADVVDRWQFGDGTRSDDPS